MPRFWFGATWAAYGLAAGLILAVVLDVGDLVVGYVKPTIGRFHP